ncbi:MAG: hypothetical protein WC242_04000 [Candidatus Paceibacterota bacterium]|jgi:hypothetical protein
MNKKICRQFVKRIVESEFMFITCIGISFSLLAVDVFYALLVRKITLLAAIIMLIGCLLIVFGGTCESHRAKLKLD